MTKDEALKLARDFIRAEFGFGGATSMEPSKLVRMLDEALAEQPERPAVQGEPVAWVVEDQNGERLEWADDAHIGWGWKKLPLYTHQQRKPLTDEEIKRMAAPWFLSMYWPLCNTFARAIEAAHGIKE